MNNHAKQQSRLHSSMTRMAILLLLLLSTCAVALSQGMQSSSGFTLTKQVTEYDDKGNSFPSLTETLYFSSSGDWRYVGTYPSGQVVETIYLCGRGVFFHDHVNNLLLKFGEVGPGRPGPTTAEHLQADPKFVRTEAVLGQLAYLQKRQLEGLTEETYYTPATGPFPFKRISYFDRFKRVEEPVNLMFGEPDAVQLRGEDYRIIEQKPLHVGYLSDKIQDQPAPLYPAAARAAGIQGKVVLQVVVDETGRVISVRILNGPPLLGDAAMMAAYRARLSPVEKDGRPVRVTGYLDYQFRPEPAPTVKLKDAPRD